MRHQSGVCYALGEAKDLGLHVTEHKCASSGAHAIAFGGRLLRMACALVCLRSLKCSSERAARVSVLLCLLDPSGPRPKLLYTLFLDLSFIRIGLRSEMAASQLA